MNKSILKIIIVIVIIIVIIIGIMYLIDLDRMKNGEKVIFSTWGAKYSPVLKTNQNENNSVHEKEQKYSKTIDNVKIELNIPNEWQCEELPRNENNDFYKFALKLYKSEENKNTILYFYHNPFGVCGTGRTDKKIYLNNGSEAIIGYYNSKDWSDISFYELNTNIALINYGLVDDEAQEALNFIKTINIKQAE